MKTVALLIFSVVCFACNNNNASEAPLLVKQQTTTVAPPVPVADTLSWIPDFNALKEAAANGNRKKLKGFFQFPVAGNDIWYAVMASDTAVILPADSVKLFTEADFDRYFDRLFTKAFVRSFSRINPQVLKDTGAVLVPPFQKENTTYIMESVFDKANGLLRFTLHSDTPIRDENGAVFHHAEFSVQYEFAIINGQYIRFKQLKIAG